LGGGGKGVSGVWKPKAIPKRGQRRDKYPIWGLGKTYRGQKLTYNTTVGASKNVKVIRIGNKSRAQSPPLAVGKDILLGTRCPRLRSWDKRKGRGGFGEGVRIPGLWRKISLGGRILEGGREETSEGKTLDKRNTA